MWATRKVQTNDGILHMKKGTTEGGTLMGQDGEVGEGRMGRKGGARVKGGSGFAGRGIIHHGKCKVEKGPGPDAWFHCGATEGRSGDQADVSSSKKGREEPIGKPD